MTIYQPYVYIIRWTQVNKGYIGVRYAKGCHPKDLFVSYYTSSKYVRQIISEFGLPDQIKIFLYSDKETALLMEEKFLKRFDVLKSDYWINKNIAGKKFYNLGHKNKKGKKNKADWALSEETRKKMSDAQKNRKFPPTSESTKQKLSLINSGENHPKYDHKVYTFYNEITKFTGTRKEFINRFGLIKSSVDHLVNGTTKKHKGWVIL